MSGDRFTKVTSQSWGSRIGDSFKGIVVGLILFVVAFPLLFMNEGRAVKTAKTLKEGGKTVVTIAADSVDVANEGKLVHLTGLATTEATLTDPVFGVSEQALKLKRLVEMYQWKEKSESKTNKKLGGGTETVTDYSYRQDWADRLVNAESFEYPEGHENPDSMPYLSAMQTADQVSLGAFTLSRSLAGKINNFEPLLISSEKPLPEALESTATVLNGGYYIGTNSAAPQIGDVRVKFEVVKPGQVSVVAKQVGNSFEPYLTQASGTIELLQVGAHSAEAMIKAAEASNRMMTWLLRLVGFVLMMGGLNLVFKPLSVLADVLPIAGTIIGAGTGIIAFLMASVGTLITVAVAWIVYRPLLGVVLLVVAVGVMVMIKGKLKPAGEGRG